MPTATKKAPAKKKAGTKKTTVPEPTQPWERQVDESGPAFDAFKTYRDMGLTRSLTRVAQQVHKNRQLMGRWSKRHSWAMRAAAWDRELDRVWILEQREKRRESAIRNAKIASGAMNAVVQGLQNLDHSKLDAQGIARLMAEASKLERLALGLSTENVELSGPGGGPVQTADVALLSDEERLQRMDALRKELDSRLARETEQEAS